MKILSLLLVSMMQLVAFSQNWTESYKDESVQIEHSKITYESQSDGINHERLVFKYVNLTDNDLTLKFDRVIAYDGVELSSSAERTFSIALPAKSSIVYSEEEKYNKLFYLFVSDNKGTIKRRLSDFKIINIETK